MGSKTVFVFGSNEAGRHGAGSAKAALDEWGAKYGVGIGRQGNSYAIPTKDENIESLPLDVIQTYVDSFIQYAERHPTITFQVVKIGCGLAGFTEDEIRPMFAKAPMNCVLPIGWRAA